MVITLNGERKEIASSWMGLKTGHYEKLVPILALPEEERDYFQVFKILTETDFKEWRPSVENEVTIWNAIKWILEEKFTFSNEIPKVLAVPFKEKLITIPKKIKGLTIGQNIALKQLIERSKYLDENVSSAVAIYLQPLIDESKFNSERVEEIKKEVEQMPVYLIRPLGFFLFKSVWPRGNGQMNYWQRIKSNLITKLGRALPSWQRSQGSIYIPTSAL